MSKIEELRHACLALHLEVSTAVAEDVSTKAEAVIKELEKEKFFVECLNSAGVEDWCWYYDVVNQFEERYPNG